MDNTTGKVITCKAAVVWGPGEPFVMEQVQVDPPQKLEVRIKILFTSICHTDLSAWKGENEAQRAFPRILGHEAAGIVESVGEGVKDIKEGDHVIPIFNGECGECICCKHQKTNICNNFGVNPMKTVMNSDGKTRFSIITKDGGYKKPIYHFLNTSTFSQYTVLDSACVVKIDSEAPLKKMTLLSCGVSTGVGAAWNIANVQAGSTVAIFGLGAVGLAVAEGARARGVSKIIGVDINPNKFIKGQAMGITDFINPSDPGKPLHERIREITEGGVESSGEASRNGIVRRMVSLPRSLIGGFSRAMGHRRGLIGIGRRRTQTLPSNFQLQHTEEPLIVPEAFAFLHSFEKHYGTMHPFFYACQFMEASKIAEDEHKFLFMYLHSPEHPFTHSFCMETLSSELVVQYLDANFVSWGALADRGEGMQMAATLEPSCFPFCAVIAPALGDSIAVLQQIEGPISPAELVGILQRTVEEQGSVFHSSRTKQQAEQNQKIIADRRLREEQDAAYLAALQIDKEKEQLKRLASADRVQKPVQVPNKANSENHSNKKQYGKVKEASTTRELTQYKEVANRGKDPQAAQILIRFPNGERREQSFSCTDKVQSIYRYIDSLVLPGIGNYRLISSFPRRVYGVDQMGMTLKDAGLHPRASLFLELL